MPNKELREAFAVIGQLIKDLWKDRYNPEMPTIIRNLTGDYGDIDVSIKSIQNPEDCSEEIVMVIKSDTDEYFREDQEKKRIKEFLNNTISIGKSKYKKLLQEALDEY